MPLRHGFVHRLPQPPNVRLVSLFGIGWGHKTVYHHLDGVVLVAVDFHTERNLLHFAVHSHIDIAFFAYGLE